MTRTKGAGLTSRADGWNPVDESDVNWNRVIRGVCWRLSVFGKGCGVKQEEEG